jgi:hypothetical protein
MTSQRQPTADQKHRRDDGVPPADLYDEKLVAGEWIACASGDRTSS